MKGQQSEEIHELDGSITVFGTCPFCHKPSQVTVPAEDRDKYWEYLKGGSIAVFGHWPADKRETLLTGIHTPECWDKYLGPPPEDDE